MKKYLYLYLCLLAALLLSGCGKIIEKDTQEQELTDKQIYIYYANTDQNDLNRKVFDYKNYDTEESLVRAVMNYMANTQTIMNGGVTLPEYMEYVSMERRGKNIVLYFDLLSTDTLNKEEEVLSKAAITKTLLQLPNTSMISFSMKNKDVEEEKNVPVVETFEDDSFVIYGSKDSGYTQTGHITIYFANEDGTGLKEYRKQVEINNNVSLEEVVVDSLITGPLREGYRKTIPDGTVLIKISIKDNVAYVDFNDAFNGSADDLRSDLTIYSVVNSLAELPTVNKVQFMINGEKQEVYRGTVAGFDGFFERNLEMVTGDNTENTDVKSKSK